MWCVCGVRGSDEACVKLWHACMVVIAGVGVCIPSRTGIVGTGCMSFIRLRSRTWGSSIRVLDALVSVPRAWRYSRAPMVSSNCFDDNRGSRTCFWSRVRGARSCHGLHLECYMPVLRIWFHAPRIPCDSSDVCSVVLRVCLLCSASGRRVDTVVAACHAGSCETSDALTCRVSVAAACERRL